MKKFSVITLFPESIESFAQSSMLKRAQEAKILRISAINPRDYTTDKHRKTDDRPYGGGPGMVMKAEPILRAAEAALKRIKKHESRSKKNLDSKFLIPDSTKIIILSPRGKQFTNDLARRYAKKYVHLVLIAGHYEGIDARVKKILKAEEISTGPYVLTGGELPALTIIDAVSRQIKGVLGKEESLEESRTASSEVYTRPPEFTHKKKTHKVPAVLFSGNHAEVEAWRKKRAR
ncbi:MAG: tRNA (guanosine(37)-N1)-methyltransferase TrmD [Patescibacteria group bacterium]